MQPAAAVLFQRALCCLIIGMGEDERTETGIFVFIAVLALAGLLLPAAVLALAAVSGLWAPGFLGALRGSWPWLAAGLLMGGFGLCTAPLGLPIVLKALFVPRKINLAVSGGFASALAWTAALAVLAVYAWGSMPDPYIASPGDSGLWAMFGALALAAGAAVRLSLEFGRFRRRLALGAVSVDREEVACVPGAPASVSLRTGNKALSVSADLKLFNSEAEELASYKAAVSGPDAAEEGWAYRVAWTVPAGVKVPEGGSWELYIEARGRGGAVAREAVAVELRD